MKLAIEYTTGRNVFGLAWTDLSDEARCALAADVRAHADESFDGDEVDAAVDIRRNIGGPHALKSYTDCLLVSYRKSVQS